MPHVYMHMYIVSHLGLGNLSGNSSLIKPYFTISSNHEIPKAHQLVVWPYKSSSYSCQHVEWCGLVEFCLGSHIVKISWIKIPVTSSRYYLTAVIFFICLFQSLYSYLWFSSSLGSNDSITDVAVGAGQLTVIYSLNYKQLWFSLVASIC